MTQRTYFSLMRHAPTDWNKEKRIQGQIQTGIAPESRQTCLRWGEVLLEHQARWGEPGPMTRIVSSDLDRAVQTANLVNRALKLPLDKDAGLREQDWGQWSGRRIRDLRAEEGEEVRKQEALGWKFAPPGGESRVDVRGRAWRSLQRLAGEHPGEHILIVTHLGVLKCVMYSLLKMRFLPEEGDPLLPNAVHGLVLVGGENSSPSVENSRQCEYAMNGNERDGFNGRYRLQILALNQDVLGG
ncbi:probable phosphoglycerate mutase [Desulfonatronum thiosulfatophilum]|uniref:Probable phosphoglycerate mutase n=1 Tax=Desulfonatronum thiosulfatophilum TaxID=617002 RepID=A0A1G6AJX7_9BACT|nr:histidine phosphatase family protein [Desulfonatronum thiosulfatophilum]SDB08727.1 probable phosphoglycerate mutase [Desulfonatronum thiosulfatophilum]